MTIGLIVNFTHTTRRIAVSSMLAAGLLSVSLPASAHDFILGVGTGTDNFTCANATTWQAIRSLIFAAQTHSHSCVVTAAADALNSEGASGDLLYHFAISLNELNPPTDSSGTRTIESRNQPNVNDPDVWPVATVRGITVPAGGTGNVFRFQCKKNSADNPSLTILDSNFSAVCMD